MRLLLRISAGLTLLGLALMIWSMMAPTPLPVMLAMTVGQAVGTTALGIYFYVIVVDFRRNYQRRARERRDSLNAIPVIKAPPAAASEAPAPPEKQDAS